MRSFIIGMRNQLSLERSSEGDELEGHVARMEESINADEVSYVKPEGRRLLQTRRLEQEYNIKRDLMLDGCGLDDVFGRG